MFSDFDSILPKMNIVRNGISDFYCVSVYLGILYVNRSVVLVLLDYILRERDKEFYEDIYIYVCMYIHTYCMVWSNREVRNSGFEPKTYIVIGVYKC